jgi:hypothetical protein
MDSTSPQRAKEALVGKAVTAHRELVATGGARRKNQKS